MAGDSDGRDGATGGPSFDPKTWLGAAKPTPVAEPEPSLDPSTWFRPGEGGDRADSKAVRPATPALSRRWVWMGGAAVVAAGAAGVWFTRRPSPAPASPPPRAVPRATEPAGPIERRRLSLAAQDDAAAVLLRLGVSDQEAEEASRLIRAAAPGALAVDLVLSREPGGVVIQSLQARSDSGAGVLLKREAGRLTATALRVEISVRPVVIHGEMDEAGFYTSAVSARMNDRLVPQFTQALAFDFDFAREVAPGDLFEAVYEERIDPAGQVVGERRLLFAGLRHVPSGKRLAAESGEIHDKAKTAELYRFAYQGGEDGWYDANGRGARRGLMRTPVDGARVTSAFGFRVHPVLGFTRLHEGVDFGTPVGTPVFASGSGVVERAEPVRGYGNYLVLRHSPRLQTAYGHLSAFGEGIARGVAVSQGQVVALSGNTGTSTGPHLHYEIIVDGVHVDPLNFVGVGAETAGQVLAGAALLAFQVEAKRIDALRSGAL
jgi:murein DD-endopeptidase MepM/ murein hydrolase activator NlpD